MKKSAIILSILCLSSIVFAADPFLKEIQAHLNALFDDGINEGTTSAKVSTKNGAPEIKCSLPVYTKGRKIVFCTAEIETTYNEGQSHGHTTCTSLGFVLDKKGKVASRYNDDSFTKCSESVYNDSYD